MISPFRMAAPISSAAPSSSGMMWRPRLRRRSRNHSNSSTGSSFSATAATFQPATECSHRAAHSQPPTCGRARIGPSPRSSESAMWLSPEYVKPRSTWAAVRCGTSSVSTQ